MAYRKRKRGWFLIGLLKMSSLRVKLSRISAKKVPALALVVVGIVGMVFGVFAASISITSTSYTGEVGTYNNLTGTMTVVDQGLSVIANVPGSANSSATFGANGTNHNIFYGATGNFVAGNWEEAVQFTDTAGDGASHTVKITIDNGSTVPSGSALVALSTVTLTGPGSASTGTITVYVGLQTTSFTAPLTIYVTST